MQRDFLLRPSRTGLQEERCLAVSCSAAVPRGRRHGRTSITSSSREASTFSHAHALGLTCTRVQTQVDTSMNTLVRIHMNLQLSRHTHASTDPCWRRPARCHRGRHVHICMTPGLCWHRHQYTCSCAHRHWQQS